MIRWTVVVVLLASLSGGGVTAEQRLSDIAGSIRLLAPEDEALFVSLGPTENPAIDEEQTTRLARMAEELLATAEALTQLLEEARQPMTFFDEEWRTRVTDACLDVESVGDVVSGLRPPVRYAASFEGVRDGVTESFQAVAVIREALARDWPLYLPAFEHLAAARSSLDRGLDELYRTRRQEIVESPPPPIEDPVTVSQTALELCSARHGADEPAVVECRDAQLRAYESIAGRHRASWGLDEVRFNVIRNTCRQEWPVDLVARDRCERQRIVGVTAGSPP